MQKQSSIVEKGIPQSASFDNVRLEMDSSHFDKEPEEIKVAQIEEEDEETKE